MSKLIPDYVFDSIYDITPEVLTAHGVRGVLVDLDGTMASHKAALPPDTLHTFVDRLKDAGIKVMETGFYETEAPACGCGAKLDHRDFGPNGKIDRLIYYISVKPEDVERAKELLADLVKPEHVAPQ